MRPGGFHYEMKKVLAAAQKQKAKDAKEEAKKAKEEAKEEAKRAKEEAKKAAQEAKAARVRDGLPCTPGLPRLRSRHSRCSRSLSNLFSTGGCQGARTAFWRPARSIRR